MSYLYFLGGFALGFVAGAGAIIFYMRWKMQKQLNAMQQDMQGMFDATEGLMDDLEEPDTEEVEDVDFEEVEEKE